MATLIVDLTGLILTVECGMTVNLLARGGAIWKSYI